MKHRVLLERLQNLTNKKANLSEIARVLGFGYSTIGNRASRNSEYSLDEINKLSLYYNVDLINNHITNTSGDRYEIPYYINDDLITDLRLPDITTIWMDRELIENRWKRKKENLRVVTMLGDKMDGGNRPIHIDDVLLMDVSDRDVTKAGVYAFTTYDDKYMYINNVYRKFDGTYSFTFANPKYPEKILTNADVENAHMRVVGRVFINLTDTF